MRAVLPNVLTDAITSGVTALPDGTPTALHANVRADEAQRLYDVVRRLRPEATLELGLAHGISALAIAQALADNGRGTHFVVDPHQSGYWQSVGLANLARAGLDERVRFFEAFPEDVITSVPRVGFAFVDASHLFDLSILDFVLVDKRLDPGGVVGFHDLWLRSLNKTVRYIVTNRHYRVHVDRPGAQPPPTAGVHLRRVVSALARRIPKAERVLRPEVLAPGATLGIGTDLTFLEKLGEDDRDWEFHREF